MDDGSSGVPIIDIGPLGTGTGDRAAVAAAIRRACCAWGFFYIVGHGVDEGLQRRLLQQSRQFFAQEREAKQEIRMALAPRAWRGYFPVGGELTSGKPDLKEGIYFGEELSIDHPLVRAGTPLHGPNLFPAGLPLFREAVLEYMAAMTDLGQRLMAGIALSLGLDEHYFAHGCTREPLTLFRIFNYPPSPPMQDAEPPWGVGEHTDYGVLTILKQDDAGGLQVKSNARWVDAPPVAGAFICNIGDMLDRMTRGRYRSTPHRVRNLSGRARLSFPFFFDPNFHAEVQPIPLGDDASPEDDRAERWDKDSVHDFRGTYGDYLLRKISKVFPDLRRAALESSV